MDISGLTFWVFYRIFPNLGFEKVNKANIEHKACIKISVFFKLLLYNVAQLKDKNKSNKIRQMELSTCI